jgi:putative ABC transport system permease protein
MMVAVAVMIGSFRQTVLVWVDQTVTSDLWLRPSKGLTNAQVALFPPQIADDVRRIPFVAAFDRLRGHDVVYGDSMITVGGGDFDVVAEHGELPMLTPRDARTALREALAKNGVLISESLSTKYDKRVGDTLTIGARAFPVTGIYRDYSNDRGVAVMDNAVYTRAFGTTAINTIVIYLKPGVSAEAARARLEATLGPKYHAFAVLNREIRAEVMKIFDQTFLITYALLAIAIVVAVLGIINTLSALILERAGELALLRLLGMTPAEVRRMIVLESSILGLASTVVGLVMGYALSWILIYVINRQSFGWTIAFHSPVRLIAASLAVTFLSAVIAGLAPARFAARVNIAGALKSE